VPDLFGRARVVSTDPSKSNSGFMFAGFAANLLSGDVVTLETLGRVDGDVGTIFKRMGFKPSSSGKLFDDYIAGGAAARPLVVGYDNQLVEWVMQDPERWKRLETAAPAKPVMLYPRPTVFSAHPVISLTREADELIDALMNGECSNWPGKTRGPLGTIGKTQSPLLHTRMLDSIDAVLPMPEAAAMMALIDHSSA
jgi:hypothetical protein